MKDKYDELRAAIAAVRKVNKGLLRVLPQWRYDGEGAPAGGNPVATQKRAALREAVTAFFREHGKKALSGKCRRSRHWISRDE